MNLFPLKGRYGSISHAWQVGDGKAMQQANEIVVRHKVPLGKNALTQEVMKRLSHNQKNGVAEAIDGQYRIAASAARTIEALHPSATEVPILYLPDGAVHIAAGFEAAIPSSQLYSAGHQLHLAISNDAWHQARKSGKLYIIDQFADSASSISALLRAIPHDLVTATGQPLEVICYVGHTKTAGGTCYNLDILPQNIPDSGWNGQYFPHLNQKLVSPNIHVKYYTSYTAPYEEYRLETGNAIAYGDHPLTNRFKHMIENRDCCPSSQQDIDYALPPTCDLNEIGQLHRR